VLALKLEATNDNKDDSKHAAFSIELYYSIQTLRIKIVRWKMATDQIVGSDRRQMIRARVPKQSHLIIYFA
jgi:hypothetical protein